MSDIQDEILEQDEIFENEVAGDDEVLIEQNEVADDDGDFVGQGETTEGENGEMFEHMRITVDEIGRAHV